MNFVRTAFRSSTQARPRPDFEPERRLGGVVAGVDEVGRGPLAGPVVAAAVILDPLDWPSDLDGLTDSKRLDAPRREAYAAILYRVARIGLGAASVEEIDRLNILQATLLAMRRAVAALRVSLDAVLVDGNQAPRLGSIPVATLVGGDGLSLSVAAASVVAKVARDRGMARLAGRYGEYGWHSNAGYGTAEHLAAIQRHGITRHHRRSFAPVRRQLDGAAGGSATAWCGPEDSPIDC